MTSASSLTSSRPADCACSCISAAKSCSAIAVADQALHELVHERGHRHRDLALPRGGQPEVEVLAQQRAR